MIDASFPDAPDGKVAECARQCYQIWKDTKEKKSAQLIFCDLSTPKNDGTFNVYDDLKRKLMDMGVPEREIAYIHNANTDIKKAELFTKVRNGQVRFLLGSTAKMGAGTNVQDRLIALHHLDVPWKPSDIEQQEGRILRQGNQNQKVQIFRYVTEGTFDSYMWQLLENKQKFIGQIMTSKSPVRSCEDVDEAVLSFAFAAAKAKSYTYGEAEYIGVKLNSGMYKNAFTCGIPNSLEVGSAFAAALGVIAGKDELGLEALSDVMPEDTKRAKRLIEQEKVEVILKNISSRIFIEVRVKTAFDEAVVTIQDAHTNITKIVVNGEKKLEKSEEDKAQNVERDGKQIHQYTLQQLYEYVDSEDVEELEFMWEAYHVNLELFEEGMKSPRTTFAKHLLKKNGGKVFSEDEQRTASLLCNAAIEARVFGLNKPAMSITGSGAHGIIATMPLYAAYKVNGYSQERLLRATALSYLICMYIKEYSGKLSAFCGCAIAAGTGMACGLVYLRGGTVKMMEETINNMAGSITGMICDGGNQGCTMKGIVAVDAAYQSAELAMDEVCVAHVHGIVGRTPEETMGNMGEIASPGMIGTEKTILDILQRKVDR